MAENRQNNIIFSLEKKWTTQRLFAQMLFAIAAALFIGVIAIRFLHVGWWLLPVLFLLALCIQYFLIYKRITHDDITSYINKSVSAAEESAELATTPYDDLNFLQKFQYQKIENFISEDLPLPARITRQQRYAMLSLLIAVSASALIYFSPADKKHTTAPIITNKTTSTKPEIILPQVKQVNVRITPPVYTAMRERQQNSFSITAEAGSVITWNIFTTSPVKILQLIFNDKSVLQFKAADKTSRKWTVNKQVNSPGFYQLKLDTIVSESYKLEVIKDNPPEITVQSPKPSTLIEAGQPPLTTISVLVNDDYAIKQTYIVATIASGSGEAVKFKEQQLRFNNFVAGSKQYQLKKQLNLTSMGMKAGDELYFYITAIDNNNQQKRSDSYIVRLEDTTALMSMDGLANGIDIKPEFFRSQRLIIIETEQLLKDRNSMSVDAFNKKSNDLGVDQKLLRLRYGKFLGEETDAEIGGDHDDHDHEEAGHEHKAEAPVFGNAEKIMEQYAHMHDQAEDATFFDAQTKMQLKATLAEMWKAELQLRTLKPKEALPFEYKALKLLKDLQQQTRVYVGKTGIKTPMVNPAKRLTGELDEILQPQRKKTAQNDDNNTLITRKALSVLALVNNGEKIDNASKQVLQEASLQLSSKAAADPAAFIDALQSLHKILGNNFTNTDVKIAGNGLQRMLVSIKKLPQQSSVQPNGKLSQRYFNNLKKRQ